MFHQNSTANSTIKLHCEVLGGGRPYQSEAHRLEDTDCCSLAMACPHSIVGGKGGCVRAARVQSVRVARLQNEVAPQNV